MARSAFINLPTDRLNYIGFRLSFQYTNRSPSELNSTAHLAITENQPVGTIVGEFNAIDPDANATLPHL